MGAERGTCKLYFYNQNTVADLQRDCVITDVKEGQARCFHYVPDRASQNVVFKECPQLRKVQQAIKTQ